MNPVVLIDVDGCINLLENGSPIRPGLVLLCDTLTCLGYTIHLWSAGGAEHARDEAEKAGIHGSVAHFHRKPDYPMTLTAALLVVGQRPALQIDDDPTERVGDWPFMVWGRP